MAANRHCLAARIDEWSIRHPHTPVVRLLSRLPTLLWRLGLGPLVSRVEVRGGHLIIVTVTGRSSGLPRHTPVTAHTVDGRTYLWCPYGGRSQWYRNVTADPVVTVQSGRDTRVMRAVAVEDADEAVEVISELRRFDVTFLHSYLAVEGIADTPEDVAANLGRLHIRRLEPAQEHGPSPLDADLRRLWLLPAACALARVLRRRLGCRGRAAREAGRTPS